MSRSIEVHSLGNHFYLFCTKGHLCGPKDLWNRDLLWNCQCNCLYVILNEILRIKRDYKKILVLSSLLILLFLLQLSSRWNYHESCLQRGSWERTSWHNYWRTGGSQIFGHHGVSSRHLQLFLFLFVVKTSGPVVKIG